MKSFFVSFEETSSPASRYEELLRGEVPLVNRSEKLFKIASDLQDCLREADKLNASLAAIKILEAHDAVLNLADEDIGSIPVIARIDIPRSSVIDSKV